MLKIIGLLLAVLFVSSCSGNDTPSEPAETSSAPSPVYGPKLSNEDYANVVRNSVVGVRNVSDETLVQNALLTCDALESGATFKDLVSAGMASGLSPDTTGGLIGAAIAWDCPEYGYILK